MREHTGTAVHASPTAVQRPQFGRSLVIGTVAALFLSATGALGTGSAPLLPRTGYWLVVMLTGSVLGGGVTFMVQTWGRLQHLRPLEAALVACLIAIPMTIVVTAAGMVVFEQSQPDVVELAWLFGVVLMVTGVMTAIAYATANKGAPRAPGGPDNVPIPAPYAGLPDDPTAGHRDPNPAHPARDAREAATPPDETGLPAPPLLARLPPHLGTARLLALEAEDHYLRVHTDAGSALILMRLSDAVQETGGEDGARCHRSWWVARRAVRSASRQGSVVRLHLDGGLEVPVSRSHLRTLRSAGWI